MKKYTSIEKYTFDSKKNIFQLEKNKVEDTRQDTLRESSPQHGGGGHQQNQRPKLKHGRFEMGKMVRAINENHSNSNVCFRLVGNSGSQGGFHQRDTNQPQMNVFWQEGIAFLKEKRIRAMIKGIAKERLLENELIHFNNRPEDWERETQLIDKDIIINYPERGTFRNMNWEDITLEEFVRISTSKESISSEFLIYLDQCDQIPPGLEQIAFQSLEYTIYNRNGCQILKRILPRSDWLLKSIVQYSKKRLIDLCTLEYSSRVLQTLTAMDEDFRDAVLRKFNTKLSLLTRNLSAIFLLTACFKQASNQHPLVKSIGVQLLQCVIQGKLPRYTKRVIVSYIECCCEEDLELFIDALGFRINLKNLFDDKYMVYIFRFYLIRGHNESIKILLGLLKNNFEELLEKKFFGFLMTKVYNDERITELKRRINSILIKITQRELDSVLSPASEQFTSNKSNKTRKNKVIRMWFSLWFILASEESHHPHNLRHTVLTIYEHLDYIIRQ